MDTMYDNVYLKMMRVLNGHTSSPHNILTKMTISIETKQIISVRWSVILHYTNILNCFIIGHPTYIFSA